MTASRPIGGSATAPRNDGCGGAPRQGGAFQWVQAPPGDSLQPEATGAGMEETKCLKPSDSGSRITVTARVCRPQRESVRRETGKEYVVRVHCDEGVATHVAPDPCAVLREDDCEASVGERIGQPVSRESVINSGADVVHSTEGNTGGCVIASPRRTRRGLRPWHVRTLFAREPGDLWIGHRRCCGRMVRSGKVRSRSR